MTLKDWKSLRAALVVLGRMIERATPPAHANLARGDLRDLIAVLDEAVEQHEDKVESP